MESLFPVRYNIATGDLDGLDVALALRKTLNRWNPVTKTQEMLGVGGKNEGRWGMTSWGQDKKVAP